MTKHRATDAFDEVTANTTRLPVRGPLNSAASDSGADSTASDSTLPGSPLPGSPLHGSSLHGSSLLDSSLLDSPAPDASASPPLTHVSHAIAEMSGGASISSTEVTRISVLPAHAQSTAAALVHPLVGQTLRGYTFIEVIGEGGFGSVFRAKQSSLGRDVAIKVVKPDLANEPEFVRRFEAEGELVARLEHPFIVPLYDFWREPNAAYMVMRLLKGGSLAQFIRAPNPERTLKLLPLLNQVAGALHNAHSAGIVHRDFKPANILLDEQGNACLADFGIAKRMHDDAGGTIAGEVVGSIAYCAPEQLRSEAVSPATDVYALGLVAFELIAGRRPFLAAQPALMIEQHLNQTAPLLSEFVQQAPPGVVAAIARCLHKDPQQRPRSTLEFIYELEFAARGGSDVWIASNKLSLGDFQTPTMSQSVQLDDMDNPYMGLSSFDEADAHNFFGRERLVEQLLLELEGNDAKHRVLLVAGPSGSGKSSVVRAGLVPALRKGRVRGSDQYYITTLRPGSDPIASLAAALKRIAVREFDVESLLKRDIYGLSNALDRCLPNQPGAECLLVVDQFEELFTLCSELAVRKHWIGLVLHALHETGSRLRVVMTLRADFMDQPLEYAELGALIQNRTVLVPVMRLDELEKAIVGPARRLGLVFDDGLVSSLLAESSDQLGALPLLQFCLSELFLRRQGREIRTAALREIGGIKGALAGRAESAYASLDENAQRAARQLLQRLTSLGEGSEDTRRRVRRSELDALAHTPAAKLSMNAAIDEFGNARLLTFDRDPSTFENTLEVAHEALLRSWSRLRGWLTMSRGEMRLQRQLAESAALWSDNQHDQSFLLGGNRLAQFRLLLNRSSGESAQNFAKANNELQLLHEQPSAIVDSVVLTAAETDFLQRSITHEDAVKKAEALRITRELEQAQALAQQQRAAAESALRSAALERRGNLRLRWLSAGLAGILVLALWQAVQIQSRGVALVQETQRANSEAISARALSDFWQSLFSQANPNLAKGRDVTVKDVLAQAATRLESDLGDAPLARARLLLTIAQTFRLLGAFPASQKAADNALAALPQETVSGEAELAVRTQVQLERGRVLADLGQLDAALAALESASLLQKQRNAPILERATVLNIHASILNDQRKYAPAIRMLREVLSMREAGAAPIEARASTASNLAYALRESGQLKESEQLYAKALELTEKNLGAMHLDTATAALNLARTRRDLGRFSDADALYSQAWRTLSQLFPDSTKPHPVMFALLADRVQLNRSWAKPQLSLELLAQARTLFPNVSEQSQWFLQQEQAEARYLLQDLNLSLALTEQCLTRAIATNLPAPRLRALLLRAKIFAQLGRKPEALVDLNDAISSFSDREDTQLAQAEVLLLLHRLAPQTRPGALEEARTLLKVRPDHWLAQQLLKLASS
jgi:serine/threonine protein kinase/tetratricopeptide (TPR) repeat protein